jgi:hypothetical protein
MWKETLAAVATLLLFSSVTAMAGGTGSISFVKQAINIQALQQLANIFRSPVLALPNLQLRSVCDLDMSLPKANGIKCIVFDKDNTLSTHMSTSSIQP